MLKIHNRIWFLLLLCLPGFVFGFLWADQHTVDLRIKAGILFGIGLWCVVWGSALARAEDHPLKTLSNLLSSLREEDYSIQARTSSSKAALKEVFLELNAVIAQMRNRRLGTMEANTLLEKMLDEMDVVVMAFDSKEVLHWINPAEETLLMDSEKNLIGKSAAELQVSHLFSGPDSSTMELRIGGRLGRWGVRRRSFRERGKLYQLVVLNDLSRALREEERLAWKRLIRVMSHEINNSLTPIVSIANSLESLLGKIDLPKSSEADITKGFQVIQSRASALLRFLKEYGRLTRLPEPSLINTSIKPLVKKCAELESRLGVAVEEGPEISVLMDPYQIEQMFINLISNAVDSRLTRLKEADQNTQALFEAKVHCGWKVDSSYLVFYVQDNGIGLRKTANLFVPFFTTKPQGSGIGLALCRQIAEGHDAQLSIESNSQGSGCFASVRLPMKSLEQGKS